MKKLILIISLLLGGLANANPPGTFVPLQLTSSYSIFDSTTLTGGASLSANALVYSSSGSASVVRSKPYSASKGYAEITINTAASGSGNIAIGVVASSQATSTPTSIASVPSGMWIMRNDAFAINNGSSFVYGGSWGAGTTLSIAFDNTLGAGSGKVWIGTCSGGTISWYSSGNPVSGTNAMFSNLTSTIALIINSQTGTTHQATLNTGATSFSCVAPSGYGTL